MNAIFNRSNFSSRLLETIKNQDHLSGLILENQYNEIIDRASSISRISKHDIKNLVRDILEKKFILLPFQKAENHDNAFRKISQDHNLIGCTWDMNLIRECMKRGNIATNPYELLWSLAEPDVLLNEDTFYFGTSKFPNDFVFYASFYFGAGNEDVCDLEGVGTLYIDTASSDVELRFLDGQNIKIENSFYFGLPYNKISSFASPKIMLVIKHNDQAILYVNGKVSRCINYKTPNFISGKFRWKSPRFYPGRVVTTGSGWNPKKYRSSLMLTFGGPFPTDMDTFADNAKQFKGALSRLGRVQMDLAAFQRTLDKKRNGGHA
ncbi:hypothetical protein [Sphingosinicella xenopeptidilytica]|uniref:Uncharacterized protein n=1 Tax=Sphingosinicella xenopeptidilytica TaxID=364098 RepID=A0ABW3C0G3_SPHXN